MKGHFTVRGEAASVAADLARASVEGALRDLQAAQDTTSPARRASLRRRAASSFRRASKDLAEAGDHAERRAGEG